MKTGVSYLPVRNTLLIKHIAKDRRVVWVNFIGLRKPRVTWHDLARLIHKIIAKCRAKFTQQDTVIIEQNTIINPLTTRSVLKWSLTRKIWLDYSSKTNRSDR